MTTPTTRFLRTYSRLKWSGIVACLWLLLLTIAAATLPLWPQFSNLSVNLQQAYLPPFTVKGHLLGTDHLGRDVLISLLQGCRTAWLLSFPPLFIATFLGILTGTAAATLGNKKARCSWAFLTASILTLLLALYLNTLQSVFSLYFFSGLTVNTSFLLIISCLVVFIGLYKCLCFFPGLRKTVALPLDTAFVKVTDSWSILPKLLLLLLLTAFTSPSLPTLIAWIALTYWVLPARLTRATLLQLQQEPFIEAAIALGTPPSRIFASHIWPSLAGPLLVNFCFSASGLLGIGSTLAFLGIGIPAEVPSWGKMLSVARFSIEAWWLLTFPAIILLTSILSLQTIAHKFFSVRSF